MYNKDTVELARRMYVKDSRSIEGIAQELKLSIHTLNNWRIRGQWDFEREKSQDAQYFAEDVYRFAAFLRTELENQSRKGVKIDPAQLKLFEILMNRVENIIKVDIERKKQNEKENVSQNIPEEVARLPRVQEAVMVINRAIRDYENKKKKEAVVNV
jgi:hypothetical protein